MRWYCMTSFAIQLGSPSSSIITISYSQTWLLQSIPELEQLITTRLIHAGNCWLELDAARLPGSLSGVAGVEKPSLHLTSPRQIRKRPWR